MATPMDSFDRHKQKAALEQVILFKFLFFEHATEDSITEFREQLRQDEEALKELSRNMPDVDEKNYHSITEEEWKLIDEYTSLHMDIDFNKEYLLSLMEMKVVYLFKSLEIIMKRIIQIAFPKTSSRDLFQWDNMKAFFKSNDIEITMLEGYDECVELRKVNNAIKHNGVINEEIKRFGEFINETEFNYINLEAFYKRVRQKVEHFSEVLKNKVEEYLFDFPIHRLTIMASEFRGRMDDVTLNAFIIEIQRQLSPNRPNNTSHVKDDFLDVEDDLPF